MNFFQKSIFFGLSFLFYSFAAQADVKTDIKVVTTIKPLHSLISRIMESRGEPQLIIEGTNNPHTFVFKPSHAEMLEEADIVFWIGEDLESFLETPLESIATNAKKITLMELDDIELLKFREKHIFEEHAEHDDHGDEHEEGHDEHEDEHGHNDEHNHGEFDIHFWLDPAIAKVIVKNIAKELSNIDVANKATYEANASKAISELDELIAETKLKINKNATYVVFHDAYQYFEERFGIEVLGALSVNPEILPGAKQLAEIREVIEHENVNCIFSEPQFNPSIAKTIAADTGVKAAVLDPLGAELDPSKDLYFDLIADMASSFSGC